MQLGSECMVRLSGRFSRKNKKMKEELRPKVLRGKARASLSGKWGASALVAFVFMLVICLCGTLSGISVLLYYAAFLFGVSMISVGSQWVFLHVARGGDPSVGGMFAPFKNYVRILTAYVLSTLAMAIGLMLFIVPGIILSLGFSMTFFILRDDAEVSAVEAMKRSWMMMRGHKWECFLLGLSFLGWAVLACITIVGLFWFIPYAQTAMAHFYEKVRDHSTQEAYI